MKLNKEWHLAYPMPKNATTGQQISWHIEHLKTCKCGTGFRGKLKAEIKKRKIIF